MSDQLLATWTIAGMVLSVVALLVFLRAPEGSKAAERSGACCLLSCGAGCLLPFLIGISGSAVTVIRRGQEAQAEHQRIQAKLGPLKTFAKAKLDWARMNSWKKAPSPYVRGRVLYLKTHRDDADSPVIYAVEDEQLKPLFGVPASLLAKTPSEVSTVVLTTTEYSTSTFYYKAAPWNRSSTTSLRGDRVTLYDLKAHKICGETLLEPDEEDQQRRSPLTWVASLPRKAE
ncbi:MAG: hypothetical protein HUU35_06630 [Armatimonadetes bacterium]|nr:hypothetical protein [Armatimonadota bacterium]